MDLLLMKAQPAYQSDAPRLSSLRGSLHTTLTGGSIFGQRQQGCAQEHALMAAALEQKNGHLFTRVVSQRMV